MSTKAREITAKFGEVLDPEAIISDSELRAACEVDGRQPEVVAHPHDIAQLQKLMSLCQENQWAVIPWGAGTRISVGNIPRVYDVALDLTSLDRVVEYDASNLVLTAEAGCTLKTIHDLLSQNDQFFPLDLPMPERTTIGGALASNSFGPSRLRYGGARDITLGMQAVLPDGRLFDLGGKTVKNVAGYDLTKLFIGSYSTLGVISQATCRLLPMPAASRTMLIGYTSLEPAFELAYTIVDSRLLPTRLDVFQGVPFSDRTSTVVSLVIGIDGSTETVDRQVRDFRAMARAGGASTVDVLEHGPARSVASRVRGLVASSRVPMVLRAGLPMSSVGSFWQDAESHVKAMDGSVTLLARAGLGVVYVMVEVTLNHLVSILLALRSRAEQQGGYLIAERMPAQAKEEVDIWGSPKDDWAIMKSLKNKFDPHGIMSPGRFVGRM